MAASDSPEDPGGVDAPVGPLQAVMAEYQYRPAPVDELLRRGRAACRHRTRRTLAAVAAAAVLAVLGGVYVIGDGGGVSTPVASDPNGAAGTQAARSAREVGVGRVAVSVPADWSVTDTQCDDAPDESVYFTTGPGCSDGAVVVSSLAVTTSEPGGRLREARDRGATVDGHRVYEGPRRCTTQSDRVEPGKPVTGMQRQCTLTFGVPDLDSWFRARLVGDDADDLLTAIRDSLRVLPEDEVTVPPASGASRDAVVAALRGLGLNPVPSEVVCPANADCPLGTTVEDAGAVVARGSYVAVTTTVSDRALEEVSGPLSCEPGTLPMLDGTGATDAGTGTAPTPEQALRDLLPGTDLSGAVYEPFSAGGVGPVWVRVGARTFVATASTPGNWSASEATFEGCMTPGTSQRQ